MQDRGFYTVEQAAPLRDTGHDRRRGHGGLPGEGERHHAGGDVRHSAHGKELLGRARALAPGGRRQASSAVGCEGRPRYAHTAWHHRPAGAVRGRQSGLEVYSPNLLETTFSETKGHEKSRGL